MAGAWRSQDGLLERAFDAPRRGDLKTLQEIVESGFDPNSKKYGQYGRTVLHEAAKEGHLQVVEYLIENGALLDVQDGLNHMPLHLAAENGHLAVVDLLIGKNAPGDVTDKKGNTPLHLAAKKGHLAVVGLLIGKNAPVDARDERGKTPLHLAAENGHLAVVDLLTGKNAPVDVRDEKGNTPLHLGAEKGHHLVVECLTEKGAPVNATNIHDRTPLHLARSKEACRILVESGAYIEAVDLNLWRPLHHAVFQNEEETITYLLEMGADVTSKDINGDTPCHVAADFDKLYLLKILLPYMKENLCNGRNQTVYDLINQHYANRKDSNKFTDLLNEFEVLSAPKVKLDELPETPRLETDDLFQHWDVMHIHDFDKEDLVKRHDAQQILNKLKETSVEEKEKYLKSLLEQFAHSRAYWTMSGHDGYDLAVRVQEFVNYFLGEAAKIDPRFAGTLELVGSCGDRTRLGQPKEFDFFLPIEDLSNKLSITRNAKRAKGVVSLEQTRNIEEGDVKECLTEKGTRKRWNNFFGDSDDDDSDGDDSDGDDSDDDDSDDDDSDDDDSDGDDSDGDKLDAYSVHRYFFSLLRETSRRLESLTKFHFSFRKDLKSIWPYHHMQHTFPLVRPMKTGCTLRFRCLETGLLIDVDVVPGIKFQGWPNRDHPVIPFDEMRKAVPPSVEDGEICYCTVPFEWGEWQLSFATLEKMILSRTEEPLLDVLKILKILDALIKATNRWSISDYAMKTTFLRYLASTEHIPGDNFSLTETVVAVLKTFCGDGSQSSIYSFFLPGRKLWGPKDDPEETKVVTEFKRLIHMLVPASPPTETNLKREHKVLCSEGENDNVERIRKKKRRRRRRRNNKSDKEEIPWKSA